MVPSDENNQFSALRLRRNRRVPYVNQACIECKRKKIKCDGVSPSSSLSHSKTQSKKRGFSQDFLFFLST
ncbi:hypothetical protein CGCSCA5_v014440 [Colletotrichum siamense]|nr:hypothetical protein CGCSCA5_v014440 [Colletotrichum siamense]